MTGNKSTPLITAAYHENDSMVAFLLEKGADPNKASQGGQRAVNESGRNNSKEKCVDPRWKFMYARRGCLSTKNARYWSNQMSYLPSSTSGSSLRHGGRL
eukprot:703754-Rhodomonas_salina.2